MKNPLKCPTCKAPAGEGCWVSTTSGHVREEERVHKLRAVAQEAIAAGGTVEGRTVKANGHVLVIDWDIGIAKAEDGSKIYTTPEMRKALELT